MKKKKKITKAKRVHTTPEPDSLESLQIKRTGGAFNFRGIEFQLAYGAHAALSHLVTGKAIQVHFEGLEDIDLI